MANELFKLFEDVRAQVNANAHLMHLGRFCNTELLIQSGEQSVYVLIEHGHLVKVLQGPLLMRAWKFALRAQPQTWNEFWQPIPAVGFNDIFAMSRHGRLVIDGDIGPLLGHLRYIKEVVAMPRKILDMTQANVAAAKARA